MKQFELQHVSFTYPDVSRPILDDVSLSIEKGSYTVLCGRSGSGKTTLLRHLKSVLAPHGTLSGHILFCGKPLSDADLRTQASRIGYVMQNPDQQIVTDKVWHELAFGLESLGCDQRTMRLRVAEMASYFGIQDWFHKDTSTLSGGQKQLLNLASIMAMQPEVLILDEPTSQLDPIAASDFLGTIRKINRELGTTILITEHRLEDILHAADQVILLDQGHVAASGSPREVGSELNRSGHVLSAAMPAPMRIFYGVQADGEAPLTVREGRNWLEDVCASGRITSGLSDLSDPADTPSGSPADRKMPDLDEPDDPILEVREAWFRYDRELPDVLKGTDFAVPRGSIFAIVGGNGTGKSTLLKSICGITRPYRGRILLDGKPIFRMKDLFSGHLAMLPQDPQSLFVRKTVREDLAEMLPSGPDQEAQITDIAKVCDILPLLDTHPYDLSGGEMQRAALAKVLLTHPRLLLLDEPTKGMDCFFKKSFGALLKRLCADGVTVILVSHDIEFCAENASLVAMFFDGQVLTTNTPVRFFSRNSFYTTAANRMARGIFPEAVTAEQVVEAFQKQGFKTAEKGQTP